MASIDLTHIEDEAPQLIQVVVSLHFPDALHSGLHGSIKRYFTLTPDAPIMPIGRGSSRLNGRGKAAGHNALFNNPIVSRQHAELILEPGSKDCLYIKDLGSMHGTSVNGERVPKGKYRLRSGDQITLGETVIQGTQTFKSQTFYINYHREPYKRILTSAIIAGHVKAKFGPMITNPRTFRVPEETGSGSTSVEDLTEEDQEVTIVQPPSQRLFYTKSPNRGINSLASLTMGLKRRNLPIDALLSLDNGVLHEYAAPGSSHANALVLEDDTYELTTPKHPAQISQQTGTTTIRKELHIEIEDDIDSHDEIDSIYSPKVPNITRAPMGIQNAPSSPSSDSSGNAIFTPTSSCASSPSSSAIAMRPEIALKSYQETKDAELSLYNDDYDSGQSLHEDEYIADAHNEYGYRNDVQVDGSEIVGIADSKLDAHQTLETLAEDDWSEAGAEDHTEDEPMSDGKFLVKGLVDVENQNHGAVCPPVEHGMVNEHNISAPNIVSDRSTGDIHSLARTFEAFISSPPIGDYLNLPWKIPSQTVSYPVPTPSAPPIYAPVSTNNYGRHSVEYHPMCPVNGLNHGPAATHKGRVKDATTGFCETTPLRFLATTSRYDSEASSLPNDDATHRANQVKDHFMGAVVKPAHAYQACIAARRSPKLPHNDPMPEKAAQQAPAGANTSTVIAVLGTKRKAEEMGIEVRNDVMKVASVVNDQGQTLAVAVSRPTSLSEAAQRTPTLTAVVEAPLGPALTTSSAELNHQGLATTPLASSYCANRSGMDSPPTKRRRLAASVKPFLLGTLMGGMGAIAGLVASPEAWFR